MSVSHMAVYNQESEVVVEDMLKESEKLQDLMADSGMPIDSRTEVRATIRQLRKSNAEYRDAVAWQQDTACIYIYTSSCQQLIDTHLHTFIHMCIHV
jgi:hypothetical protein